MHIEGFNIHALEGAIHIARSISFVAVAAIRIDKTNIFLTSPAICIVLTIPWSMSKAIHISVYALVELCKQMVVSPLLRRKMVRTSVKVFGKRGSKHKEIHQQRATPVN